MPPPDRALNDSFLVILRAVNATVSPCAEFSVQNDFEDSVSVWDHFTKIGILSTAQHANSLICDGCEHGCFMPVEILPAYNSTFIVCDKTPNMGRIEIDADDLRRWRSSVEQLAQWLAWELKTNQTPTQYDENGAYNLGPCDIGGTSRQLILSQEPVANDNHGDHLFIEIDPDSAPSHNTVRLSDLVVFEAGQTTVRMNVLVGTQKAKPKDTAAELTLIDNRLMLENCKTGHTVQVAKPHFDSTNARLIEALFAKPGIEMTTGEVWRLAEVDTEKDIHKALDELGFRKARRKAFVRVAKGTILFQPKVSQEKLTSLGLSTEDLFNQ